MQWTRVRWLLAPALLAAALARPAAVDAACCYFSAQNADILQPSQKVFITWDPEKKLESFTVQPKFEGNALDFGMVIPTPSQPKLHEMPREFFKHLAVYSILSKREFPQSKLLPMVIRGAKGGGGFGGAAPQTRALALSDGAAPPKPAVIVLETGVVGSLDYKIISAERADDLFKWLKDNKYSYSGDEATLNLYVQKKWIFTVMKIDTMQMKKNKDGSYAGEVTPTRFQFTSEKLCYPLKITQISVKDKTEALIYVQAPFKTDLQGDMSYQYTWVPMLQSSVNRYTKANLPGRGSDWLAAISGQIPGLQEKSRELGYVFQAGQRPQANAKGRIPTTMEWARKLTEADIKILQGKAAFSQVVPNVDEGFSQADLKDPQKAEAIYKVIRDRLAKSQQECPEGYLVRHVPKEDIDALQQLAGHLQAALFITKFRKTFTRDEMNDDLLIVAARMGDQDDFSEYQEVLPTSPP